jgi:zinc transport system substrate-binding protein
MRAALIVMLVAGLAAGAWRFTRPRATTPAARAPDEMPVVQTAFYPTTYFVERMAKGLVRVECRLPPDVDPAFWLPDEAAIVAFQSADLVVLNGAEFERFRWLVSLAATRTVFAAEGFRDQWMQVENAVVHSHGGGALHTHQGLNGHTWVDPMNAIAEVEAIRRALVRRLPVAAATMDARAAELTRDLDALDRDFAALDRPRQVLYLSHPAWNYLARRHGWPVEDLTLDPLTMPTPEQIAAAKVSLSARPGSHILWESEPSPAVALRIRNELGLDGIVFPPCETDSRDGRDYLSRMRESVKALRPAFAAR